MSNPSFVAQWLAQASTNPQPSEQDIDRARAILYALHEKKAPAKIAS